MSIRMFVTVITVATLFAGTNASDAALIKNAISGVTGKAFQQGDSPDPGNGSISRILDGSGLTVGNINNPATWTHDNQWQNNWQGNGSFSGTATEKQTPGAWLVADLGSVRHYLDDIYIWNVREVLDRGVKNVDIYYATSPTINPVTGSAGYNFTSGGWSLLGNYTINAPTASFDNVIDISSIPEARYIGFNMLTNYGSNFRTGFAEIQITAQIIPEPATASLALLGLAGMMIRRRHA